MEQQVQEGTHSLDSYCKKFTLLATWQAWRVTTLSLHYRATTKQTLCLTLLRTINKLVHTHTRDHHLLSQWPNTANTIWTCRKSHKLQVYCNMQWTLWLRCIWSYHVYSQPVAVTTLKIIWNYNYTLPLDTWILL